MRIALVVPSDYYHPKKAAQIPSGIAVYTRGLARALVNEGHQVSVLCQSTGSLEGSSGFYEYEGSVVFPLAITQARFSFAEAVHDWLSYQVVDVAESHQSQHPLLLEQMLGGTPTVVRYASNFLDSMAGGVFHFDFPVTSLVPQAAAKNICWSTHLAECATIAQANVVLGAGEKAVTGAKAYSDRVDPLPPGIVWPGETRGETEEDHLLISVARFYDPRKGGEIVPSLLKHIPEKYSITVLGELEENDSLVDRIESDSRVTLLSQPVTDGELHNLYARSKAVIVPTKSESFGYVFLEPMARRTPVICFAQPDPSKARWPLWNLPGAWGSEEAMSAIPNALAALESKYEAACEDAEIFAKQFAWDKLIKMYEASYLKAISHSLLSGRTRGW